MIVRAALLDVVSILVFVAVGRRNHDETGNAIVGMAKVAAPFLIALAVAWLIVQVWKQPESLKTGLIVWSATVVDGMLLRRFVFDRGTATSFIIVATIATGVLILGWRVVAGAVRSRRAAERI